MRLRLPASRLSAFSLFAAGLLVSSPARAQRAPDPLSDEIDRRAQALAAKVTAWRHDIHQNPELSNQEVRTSKLVADHLKSLGIEVRENVGGTHGVVGILRGGKPGPVVGLRADMDALPVVEQVNVPY